MEEKKIGPAVPGNPYHQGLGERHQFETDLRAELGRKLREILFEKKLKQRELSALLAIQQPEVSHLFNGHFNRFTVDKLILLFNRLGFVVKFQIHSRDS